MKQLSRLSLRPRIAVRGTQTPQYHRNKEAKEQWSKETKKHNNNVTTVFLVSVNLKYENENCSYHLSVAAGRRRDRHGGAFIR